MVLGCYLTTKLLFTPSRFAQQYLNSNNEVNSLRVSPGLEKDLAGLPPCLTVLATHDMLYDEGLQYATRWVRSQLRDCI